MRGNDLRIVLSAARLAAQMAREPAGRWRTIEEIAQDAVRVARLGAKVRASTLEGKAGASVDERVERAGNVLSVYSARVVDRRDPESLTMGAKFPSYVENPTRILRIA